MVEQKTRNDMTNKTIGTVLLVTAGTCCTLGIIGAKLAFALERGMTNLAKGGISPKRPELGWEVGFTVIGLAVLGLIFLFKQDGSGK